MARILTPMPGLKVRRIQGENSPFLSTIFWPETSSTALSSPGSRAIFIGSRISTGFSSMVLSGPESCASTFPARTSTGKKTPPSRLPSLAGSDVKKANVPWLPLRSGAHMPDRRWPLNFSGGKVRGTRSTVLKIPWSPRIFQKGTLLRRACRTGLESGIL